ncbi:MAG TPA: DUF3106 domain-containing protein [Terriglobales bacterium]|jgi:hypothetical protein
MLNKIPVRVWSAFWRFVPATVFAACLILSVCSVTAPAAFAQAHAGHMRQGHHAGQWLRKYKDVPPEQQEKALENDPEFRRLPPDRQQKLRERLQRFNNLPPQQQQRVLSRMETWEHLTPEQKQSARQIAGRFQTLPPARRAMLRNAINELREVPPGQREQMIDSDRFKSQFTPEELGILHSVDQLPLAPAEAGAPAPHN